MLFTSFAIPLACIRSGFLSNKFGRFLFTAGAYSEAIKFLRLSCDHYTLWVQQAKPDTRDKQVSRVMTSQ